MANVTIVPLSAIAASYLNKSAKPPPSPPPAWAYPFHGFQNREVKVGGAEALIKARGETVGLVSDKPQNLEGF